MELIFNVMNHLIGDRNLTLTKHQDKALKAPYWFLIYIMTLQYYLSQSYTNYCRSLKQCFLEIRVMK